MRLRRLLRRTDEVPRPPSPEGDREHVGRRRMTVSMLTVGAWAFLRRLVSAAEPGQSVAQIKPQAPQGPPVLKQPAPPQGQIPQQQKSTQQDAGNWNPLLNAVGEGVQYGVNFWKLQAKFADVQIMSVSAIGGRVDGPELFPLMHQSPKVAQLQGQQRAIVDAFLAGVSDSWGSWQRSLSVPGLPWYPAFAAFPLASAPPMPNIPTPIATLKQDPSALAPPGVAAAIRNKLGPNASLPGAEAAVGRFANAFGAAALAFVAQSQVMLVLGKGPVPTYAPPYVPVGPVLGGDIISTPGHFMAAVQLTIPPFL